MGVFTRDDQALEWRGGHETRARRAPGARTGLRVRGRSGEKVPRRPAPCPGSLRRRPSADGGQCRSGQCRSGQCRSGQLPIRTVADPGQCRSGQCRSGQCRSGQCRSGHRGRRRGGPRITNGGPGPLRSSAAGRLRFLDAAGAELLAETTPHLHRGRRPAGTRPRPGGTHHFEVRFTARGRRALSTASASNQHGRPGPEGRGRRADPAQHRGLHPVSCCPAAGYGFLWNHPGIGRVELGTTVTRLGLRGHQAVGTYWITAADEPAGPGPRPTTGATGPSAGGCPAGRPGFWQWQAPLQDPGRAAGRGGASTSAAACRSRSIVIDYFHWNPAG